MLLIALILACQVWTIGGLHWRSIVTPEDEFEVVRHGICVSVTEEACAVIALRRYGITEYKWRSYSSAGLYKFKGGNYPAGCHLVGPDDNLKMHYNTNDGKSSDCTPEKRCICVKGSTVDICPWHHLQDGISETEKGQEPLFKAGKTSERECIEKCEQERETDPTINGVVRKFNGFCWCKPKMTGMQKDDSKNKYQACWLGHRTAASKWAARPKKYRIRIDNEEEGGRNCAYMGYTPGGNVKEPGRISAPTAEIVESSLAAVMEGSEYAAGLGQGTAEVVTEFAGLFADTIPKMAPVVGIFGVAFSIIKDKMTPGPQEILDSVNNAISDLAKEVDDKIQNMKYYVEDKLKCAMKKLTEREFMVEFTAWLNCRKPTTKEDANDCQCNSAYSLINKQVHFAVEYARMKGKDYLSLTTLKEIEAKLMLFRDWANLQILVLKALIDTWQVDPTEKGPKEFERFKYEMTNQTKFFDEYYNLARERLAQWHMGKAKFPYDRSNKCVKTLHCQTLKNNYEYPRFPSGLYCTACAKNVLTSKKATCTCVINEADGQVCEVDLTLRVDAEKVYKEYDLPTSDEQEAVKMVAKDFLVPKARNMQLRKNYLVYSTLWHKEIGIFNKKVWKPAGKWAAEQTYKGGWKSKRSDVEESSGSGSAEEEEKRKEDEEHEDRRKRKHTKKAWEEAEKDVAALLKKMKEERKKSVTDGDGKNAFVCPYR